MKLYVLLHGNAKSRMKPIMVDSLKKCKTYQDSRELSGVKGFHSIEDAPSGSSIWRQKTCTIKGSGDKHNYTPPRVGKGSSGYITKNGFMTNT